MCGASFASLRWGWAMTRRPAGLWPFASAFQTLQELGPESGADALLGAALYVWARPSGIVHPGTALPAYAALDKAFLSPPPFVGCR